MFAIGSTGLPKTGACWTSPLGPPPTVALPSNPLRKLNVFSAPVSADYKTAIALALDQASQTS